MTAQGHLSGLVAAKTACAALRQVMSPQNPLRFWIDLIACSLVLLEAAVRCLGRQNADIGVARGLLRVLCRAALDFEKGFV